MRASSLLSTFLAAEACVAQALDLTPRDTASDIWDAIKDAADCTACQAVLGLLKGVADLGDSVFVDTLTEICKLSGAEDDDVCEGAIGLEGPIIAHDLRNMDLASHTSDWFCITFLGLCSYPDVTPYTVSFPKSKPSTGRPVPSGKDPIQIVQYSDIHVDPFYVPGASTNCTKPICCRVYDSSDAPGNNSSPAGPNGDHSCDAPTSLEDSMYAAINDIAPNAKFSIFTGDIVDHAVWNTTQPQNTIDIDNAYQKMASALNLVYGVTGNHEMSPVNAFSTEAQGNSGQWVYDLLSSAWNTWIGSSAASEADKIGAYSAKYPGGNLRIISVNTNFYYVQNYWLYEQTMETDPSGQLAWIVEELQAAEDAGERVYIIGHMPMGCSDAFHDTSNYFDQIVNRYSSTIAAMFFGHTHDDEFEISYSDYSDRSFSNAIAYSYIMPSMTPTSGHPTFRVYSVDPDTFAVLDSVTYFADMTNPAYQTTGPVWTKYYSAKETYGPMVSPQPGDNDELSPAFWHNVTVAFENDSPSGALDDYIARKSRGWDVESCTGDCATQEICKIRSGRAQDNCVTPTPGVNFSKRDLDAEGNLKHVDECGISVSGRALAALLRRKDLLEKVAKTVERR